ncbi:MAG: hypothetical protein ACRDTN_02020 [Mycobacterium sp.]
MSRRSNRFYRVTAFTTGTAVASAALIGAAPVPQPSLPDAVPVVQVQDVALTAFDGTPFIIPLEIGVVAGLRELARLTGVGDLTTPEWLDKFGLGQLTPNELLHFTGLGNVTLGDLNHLAGFFGLNQNPVSLLLALTGLSDTTTLPGAAGQLGITDLPLSNLYNLIGMPDYQDSSLSDLATHLGLADGPVSNLYGLLGLNADSTLEQTVAAFGIGDTPVDTLLGDWDVADQHINGFLQQLSVSPEELFQIFSINPSSLGSMWDPSTDAFAAGTTVEDFANATGLGHDTVSQLLTAGDLDGATLNDALTGIGLQPDATVNAVLNTIGFNNLSIGDFLGGLGLDYGPGYTNTVGDLLTSIPGFQHGTIGDLLAALGLSDHSTINDMLTTVPGLDGTTPSGLVGDLGWGDTHVSDLASNLLGDTTVDQYLTAILAALVTA